LKKVNNICHEKRNDLGFFPSLGWECTGTAIWIRGKNQESHKQKKSRKKREEKRGKKLRQYQGLSRTKNSKVRARSSRGEGWGTRAPYKERAWSMITRGDRAEGVSQDFVSRWTDWGMQFGKNPKRWVTT